MAGLSDVWIGGGFDDENANGKTGDVATGTASSADAPIVISMG